MNGHTRTTTDTHPENVENVERLGWVSGADLPARPTRCLGRSCASLRRFCASLRFTSICFCRSGDSTVCTFVGGGADGSLSSSPSWQGVTPSAEGVLGVVSLASTLVDASAAVAAETACEGTASSAVTAVAGNALSAVTAVAGFGRGGGFCGAA
jgi:hypothetical protein